MWTRLFSPFQLRTQIPTPIWSDCRGAPVAQLLQLDYSAFVAIKVAMRFVDSQKLASLSPFGAAIGPLGFDDLMQPVPAMRAISFEPDVFEQGCYRPTYFPNPRGVGTYVLVSWRQRGAYAPALENLLHRINLMFEWTDIVEGEQLDAIHPHRNILE